MIEFTFVCFHRLQGITRVWEHVVVPKQLWKLKLRADHVSSEERNEALLAAVLALEQF